MKYISIILLSVLLVGCQQVYTIGAEPTFSDAFKGFPLYYGDFSDIKTINDIPKWMQSRIVYEVTDPVQSPQETIERGVCDCDGYAILYMNIAYVRFGVKPSLCLVDSTRDIVSGGFVDHAIVKVNGKYICPQSGRECNYVIGYEYDFDHVFDY